MTGILERQTHPDLEIWRKLLDRSLLAMADFEAKTGQKQQVRLGGGTVLSALWGHRYSQDVDLFTNDLQVIAYLTPRLNDDIATILGTDYVETGSAIKFNYGPGKGSIDIVAATDILPDAKPTTEMFRGWSVEIDDPAEIIAKKLFHRGDRATVRDYVDLVEGIQRIPNLAKRLARPLSGIIERALVVARESSDEHLSSGLDNVRFITPAPSAKDLRTATVNALTSIKSTPGGNGQMMAFHASRGMGF